MNIEKFLNTNMSCSLDDMSGLWTHWTDKQRINAVKSIIFTSPDNHSFYKKLVEEISEMEDELD